MDGRQLNRLARRLHELAREASTYVGDSIPTAGEAAVLGAIAEHPGSSIRQLCEHTGFVQSHVSSIVAGLTERGLLTTSTDPADRRRTLVHPAEPLLRGIQRRQRPIDDTLTASLGDPETARRACELLDDLAVLLLPATE